jgi:hypothetical protein
MEEKIKYIYGLKDPRNQEIKYIGSSYSPSKRLQEHIYDTKREKTKKSNWIKKLLLLDLKPEIEILKNSNDEEYLYWESFFIKYFKSEGFVLLNYDDNGVGNLGVKTKKDIINLRNNNTIKIIQYDLNGLKINDFISTREAERITGINHGNISKCCNGIFKHSGGFIFKKENDKSTINIITNPNGAKRKVLELYEDGTIKNEFDSISQASKETKSDAGAISRVCNGKLNKTNNKYFKFKTNE